MIYLAKTIATIHITGFMVLSDPSRKHKLIILWDGSTGISKNFENNMLVSNGAYSMRAEPLFSRYDQ